MKNILVAIFLGVTLPWYGTALANNCSSVTNDILFNNGQSIGAATADAIWEDPFERNCFQLEAFIGVMAEVVDEQPKTCIGAGFIQGVNDTVDTFKNVCVGVCLNAGEDLGKLLGSTFCALRSDATGWQPPPLCNLVIEASCKANFDAKVLSECPDRYYDPYLQQHLENLRNKCRL